VLWRKFFLWCAEDDLKKQVLQGILPIMPTWKTATTKLYAASTPEGRIHQFSTD